MTISKLFFISDIHGDPSQLENLLSKIKQEKQPYKILILGDELYHGPRNALTENYNVQKTITLLTEFADKIIAVRGNCDAEVDQVVLPYSISDDYHLFKIDALTFFLTHGHIYSPNKLPPISPLDVFCYGHIHLPILQKEDNGLILFNPGSISLPRNGNPPSYGIYEKHCLTIYNALNHTPLKSLTI